MKNKDLHKKLVQQKKYKAAYIVRQGEGKRQFISNTLRSVQLAGVITPFGQISR